MLVLVELVSAGGADGAGAGADGGGAARSLLFRSMRSCRLRISLAESEWGDKVNLNSPQLPPSFLAIEVQCFMMHCS